MQHGGCDDTLSRAVTTDAPAAATSPPPQTHLPLPAAVLLLHAWCGAQFEASGLRALFIKGPALAQQGLRPARISSDVDILASPADFDGIRTLLQANGWTPRPSVYAGDFYDDHSISFVNEKWPCDVDVHRRYPGFLADPDIVFERLWSDRVALTFAHVECWTCDRPANALIMALHALRGAVDGSRHQRELIHLTDDVVFSDEERQRLSNVAAATGATLSADGYLGRLSLPPSLEALAPVDPRALRAWHLRLAANDTPVWVWLDAYRQAKGARRVRVVARALWPSRQDLEMDASRPTATVGQRLRVRVARLADGIPAAARLLVRSRSASLPPARLDGNRVTRGKSGSE